MSKQEYINPNKKWIGKIPSDWDLVKIKHHFIEKTIKVDDVSFPPLSVTMGGIVDQMENVSKSDDSGNRKLVEMGDFVINSRSDRKGSSGISPKDGSVSLINIVLQPKNINPKYSEYLFKSYYFKEEFFRNGKGIHFDLWSTRYELMKQILIPFPKLDEQKKIVSYLDQNTQRIDKLIQKIELKIELLKEQKDSIVNDFISRGVEPNVNLKNSDIEWLDEIPTHWKIVPLLSVCEETQEKNEDDIETVLTLSYGKLKIKNIETNFGLLPESFENYQRIRPGYIVLRLLDLQNDKKSLRVGHSYLDGIITPVYVSLKCNEDIDSEFLYFFLHNSDIKKVLYSLGGGLRQTLRFSELKKLPILLPPKDEQKLIVEKIKTILLTLDSEILKERSRVKIFKEYKQSLISEIVLGKKRVI